MHPFVTGSLIAGGLGAVSSLFNSFMNRRSVADANAANERLSWSQWHATNAYNHPKAQMQRFREAGLNPNLIYGQMSNVPPPAFVRSTPVPGLDIGMDKVADAIQNAESFELQRASTEHNMVMSEAGLALQARRLNSDLDLKSRELDLQEQLLPYKIDQIRTGNELNRFTLAALLNPSLKTDPNTIRGQYNRIVNHPNFDKLPWYTRWYSRGVNAISELLDHPIAKSIVGGLVGSQLLKGSKFSFR